jgi:hypothetical protein
MPDRELEAMQSLSAALSELDPDARRRVLSWASDRFDVALRASSVRRAAPDDEMEEGRENFKDVGDLVHAAQPTTGPEHALVVAYWFQEIEGRDGWGGGDLNDALRNMGAGLANVTKTLDLLKARKPALVMQIGKSGRSRQARKTYKLTTAGVREVRAMLARGSDQESVA